MADICRGYGLISNVLLLGHNRVIGSPFILRFEQQGRTMFKRATIAMSVTLAFSAAGCADLQNRDGGIMQATPGDPAGSANIGTGSVTINGISPPEAKAAGIGLGP